MSSGGNQGGKAPGNGGGAAGGIAPGSTVPGPGAHAGPHGPRCSHPRGGHVPAPSSAGGSLRRLSLSLGLTAGVMVAETVGGLVSGSLALLSDAAHMLTDASALGLAVVAAYLATRPADVKRTFGFRRAEVLAAQLNVGALVVLSAWIGWEAVDRLRHPGGEVALGVMAGVAGLGLAANLAILWFLHAESGLNARSAFLHVLSDTVSSLAVLLGAVAMALRPELRWIDPALSLVIAGLILLGAVRLILEITDILMEAVPKHIDVGDVLRQMEAAHGVVAVHDLHVWTISSNLYALSAHLVVASEAMGQNDAILTAVKGELRGAFGIDLQRGVIDTERAAYEHVHDMHRH